MGDAVSTEKNVKHLLGAIPIPEQKLEATLDTSRQNRRVIVISGPTGVGKTQLSMRLAKLLCGEIVSADAVQVYKNMDIGTAKVSRAQREQVIHHLIDICEVSEDYNAARYSVDAKEVIEAILARGRVPIVVGGSGFYLRALMQGPPKGPSSDPNLRATLEREMELMGVEWMYNLLKQQDPQYAEKITCGDRQKIIRALEIIALTQQKVSDRRWEKPKQSLFDFQCYFLHRPRAALYKRIERRCEQMCQEGLLEEVNYLLGEGLESNKMASHAIGYRQAIDYLKSPQSLDDYQFFIEKFKTASRRYAKRQFTWFGREPDFKWVDLSKYEQEFVVDEIMQEYLGRL